MNKQQIIDEIKEITKKLDIKEYVDRHTEPGELLFELKRLMELKEEFEAAIEKHNNDVGNYHSMKRFGKLIKDCNINELMQLGIMFENIYKGDLKIK